MTVEWKTVPSEPTTGMLFAAEDAATCQTNYEEQGRIYKAMIDAAPVQPTSHHSDLAREAVARRVRHKKRGTTYRVIGVGKMQAENWATVSDDGYDVGASVDMAEVTVYQCEQDGSLWVRPATEFEDGRFEDIVSASPAPAASGGLEAVREAWTELCERDDRTSPAEHPDMCLITREELAEFMSQSAGVTAGDGQEAMDVDYKFTRRAHKIICDAAGSDQGDWSRYDHDLMNLTREADETVAALAAPAATGGEAVAALVRHNEELASRLDTMTGERDMYMVRARNAHPAPSASVGVKEAFGDLKREWPIPAPVQSFIEGLISRLEASS